ARPTPVAAPASDLLVLLGDLLARLLPVPVPAPAPGIEPAAPPAVSQVAASTVRVSGVACGRRLFGSGFSPAPDTIVTNAHVVAGTRGAEVLRPDGRTLPATVVAFDPARDLAVLAVPGLGQPSLPLGTAVVGENDAVYGHPFGRAALEVSPAQVLRRVTVDAGDIYDRASIPRQILVLGANLDPGDSGGALVNRAGQVIGVAFAVSNLRRGTAFAVAAEELAPVLAQPRSGPVGTGACLR
ncbi:MAG: trypsin-like peptidase domain-containing protein, partial [Acidimicrobiales bacterium]|nr:trypsin-like peptidase domain-containing protein [Acidimicrobiales bacterium]